MQADTNRPVPPPDWRKLGRGAVVPTLLLVALLFLLGRMHVELAGGFSRPRIVQDDQGLFVFYDEGARTPSFTYRTSTDGQHFSKPKRVVGDLTGAALNDDDLVTLFAGVPETDRDWFYSIYNRQTLERRWSSTVRDPDLKLATPHHIASIHSDVFVFGGDSHGNLRAARLSSSDLLVPVDASLPDAVHAPVEDPRTGELTRWPRLMASASDGDQLTLIWRVLKGNTPRSDGPGEVRWTTFDGSSFGTSHTLSADLVAFAPVVTQGFGSDTPRLVIFGVPASDPDSSILVYVRGEEGGFTVAERIPVEPASRFGTFSGISALAVAHTPSSLLLLAQVGNSIRLCTYDTAKGSWSAWKDFATLPAEQRLVVYGWFLSLLALCAILILQGLRLLAQRNAPLAPRTPPPATPNNLAPLWDRSLAFIVDVLIVLLAVSAIIALDPALTERVQSPRDPNAQVAAVACACALLLAYFCLFEGLFASTPGKRIFNLEVQDLAGQRPPLSARIYRNLFRIELLFLPNIVAPASLLFTLINPYHQRPGDLLVHTTVRVRSPHA